MTSRTEQRRWWVGVLALAACALLASPAQAMTVEEVIAKHVEAHGGSGWDAIRTMKITGSYTAFSKITPFTLHRKRDNQYHMDTVMNGNKYVAGYDGTTGWWDNHFMQEGATPVSGPDYAALIREVDFCTPFFDYKEKGYQVELIGETEYEGYQAIGIKLTRPDESEEHWYLDPETYLALARTSPGSDFGRPMTQRTFFDDYRDVSGVKVPYLTETQWYTRDRVMNIENIEINVEIDDGLFRMPLPLGMEPLRYVTGSWHVKAEQRGQPTGDFNESEYTSVIESRMGGALLEEHYEDPNGTEILRTLSYDRFSEVYRMTQMTSRTTHLDVRVGTLAEDGRLTLSNMETGTKQIIPNGPTVQARTSIFDITENGFETETEVSVDAGENWWVAVKASYTRKEEEAETASN
jgi:hypothetical protein